MSKVYISSLESNFGRSLARMFEKNGYTVTQEPEPGLEFFIDVTEYRDPRDDKEVGEGIDPALLEEAYERNVCFPVKALDKAINSMEGKKRICFLSSRDASSNISEKVSGFGFSMSKAALHNILIILKNTMIEKGYTFRLFDPMTGSYCAQKAAAAAYQYFVTDRFFDEYAGPERNDEYNLILRDALGREIPW